MCECRLPVKRLRILHFLVARLGYSLLTENTGREKFSNIAGLELYSHRVKPLVTFGFDLREERIFHMLQQIAETKKYALENLYERIEQIVMSMNGTFTEMDEPNSLPDWMTDGPSNLSVTALHTELPNGLIVDFKPQNPLGIGNTLSVKARRILRGRGTLDDIDFSFVNSEWQSGRKTLSDDAILECLTSKGPIPIY